jgi:hypothetical protein
MDNPNTIILIDKMDDVNKAKDFSMLPSLKGCDEEKLV